MVRFTERRCERTARTGQRRLELEEGG